MAGDGGRAPDVSEQRAKRWAGKWWGIHVCPRCGTRVEWRGEDPPTCWCHWPERVLAEYVEVVPLADPASVLAALLAEQPDATIAALETLLTSDEAMERAVVGMQVATQHEFTEGYYRSLAAVGLKGACRSLRPKAPKEDRDA